jgi:hypothetical protein
MSEINVCVNYQKHEMLGIAAGVAFSSMEPPQQLNPSDIYPTVKEQANEKPSWYRHT